MAVWRRCLRFFRPDVRSDVNDELRFHLDARISEYEAHGYSHLDAVRMARDRFGDPERVRRALETHDFARQRRENRREYMGQLFHDIRIALRSLGRTPAFTMTVLTTLALGIGANAAVFSVVSRELIDPLPYHDPDRLVLLDSKSARGTVPFVSPREIDQLQHSSRSLASVAAFGWYSGYTYVGERETIWWEGATVDPNFFQTLGVRPALGRLIDARDVESGPAHVIVLSHAVWVQAFGGDPGVVGRTIRLNEGAWTVIGVTPADFAPPARAPQVWTPLDMRQWLGARADSYMLQAVGRIANGGTLVAVQSEVAVFGARAAARRPANLGPLTLVAVPIREALVGDVKPVLLVLMGAALLVLALACVNLTGLFLARATARSREIAVRSALGAGRWRIARELVTETMVLGLAGGSIGMVLANWGRLALTRLGADVLPSTGTPASIDARVLIFGCVVSVLAGGVSGLVPAMISVHRGLTSTLSDGSRSATTGHAGVRAGRVLVAGQMAFALLLLVVAGLLGRALFALQRVDLGFDASPHVLSVHVVLPNSYAMPQAQSQFFGDWLARVRRLPGVRAAGLIDISPWNGWNHEAFQVEHGPDGHAVTMDATFGHVSDGYFAAVGTAIVSGRPFGASDRVGTQPVAIVGRIFAQAAWPSRSPLGERLRIDRTEGPWLTVVGVADDVREDASSNIDTAVYLPAWQSPQRAYEALVRTPGDASLLVPAVRDTVRVMDPAIPVLGPRTLDEIMRASLTPMRLPVIFTAAFALLALVLAVVGVYGIVAYSVTLRTRELGIRTALGGRRADIIRLVLSDGLRVAAAGTAIGMVLAVIGSGLLARLLYGVSAHDPATYAAAAGILIGASAVSALIPAKRATRIDPIDALRSE